MTARSRRRASHGDEIQGNLLLDHLVGARVQIVDAAIGPHLEELLLAKAAEYRAAGRHPYSWDRKRVRPIAAVSYAFKVYEVPLSLIVNPSAMILFPMLAAMRSAVATRLLTRRLLV